MNEPIKIAYAYSQKLLPVLFKDSGWNPRYLNGKNLSNATIEQAIKANLWRGYLFEGESQTILAHFYAIRSADILERVHLGKRDIAFVGRDHFEERPYPGLIKVGEVPHARTSTTSAELQAWVTPESILSSLADITEKIKIRTELPNYSAIVMEETGTKTKIRPITDMNPLAFRQEAEREGKIAIEFIQGGGSQQLEDDEVLFIINETGGTMLRNDRRSIGTICTVEQLIVANANSWKDPEKRPMLDRFVSDIEGVHIAQEIEALQSKRETIIQTPRGRRL